MLKAIIVCLNNKSACFSHSVVQTDTQHKKSYGLKEKLCMQSVSVVIVAGTIIYRTNKNNKFTHF